LGHGLVLGSFLPAGQCLAFVLQPCPFNDKMWGLNGLEDLPFGPEDTYRPWISGQLPIILGRGSSCFLGSDDVFAL
jgi:hypothetical protein